MIAPLNPWLDVVLRKADRLFEDADRQSFAAREFFGLIKRVHLLATASAHVAPEPKLERLHLDSGGVLLSLEWLDKDSGWFLMLGIKRGSMGKPWVVLEFSGNPHTYSGDNPTDAGITKAMHDYFRAWKAGT